MKTISAVPKKKVLVYNLSEPFCGAATMKVEIDTASGNLAIDPLSLGEPLLASGTLEYVENQKAPTCSVSIKNGEAVVALRSIGMGRPSFRFPWSACNGATDWHIHLNPDLPADITACSGGGNVTLDLADMKVTRLSAETGGGNLDVVLPEDAAALSVTARTGGGNVAVEIGYGTKGNNSLTATSGAGNIEVYIPSGLAARIYATSGWGKEIMDQRFATIENHTYQSAGFERAADRIDITIQSGAGNVIVHTR